MLDWDDRFSEESISDELIRTRPIFEPLLNKIHHFFHHSRKFFDSGAQASATIIHADNQSCIALAHNPVNHLLAKHIDIKHHFIRKRMERGEVKLKYVSTKDMLVNVLQSRSLVSFLSDSGRGEASFLYFTEWERRKITVSISFEFYYYHC